MPAHSYMPAFPVGLSKFVVPSRGWADSWQGKRTTFSVELTVASTNKSKIDRLIKWDCNLYFPSIVVARSSNLLRIDFVALGRRTGGHKNPQHQYFQDLSEVVSISNLTFVSVHSESNAPPDTSSFIICCPDSMKSFRAFYAWKYHQSKPYISLFSTGWSYCKV
jgi:hypothetical protein